MTTVGYGFGTSGVPSASSFKRDKKKPALGKSIRELKFESPYIRVTNRDSHGNAVRRILFDKNSSLQSTLYENWLGNREGMDRVLELMYTPNVASLKNPYSYGAKTASFSYIPEPNTDLLKPLPTVPVYGVWEKLPDIQNVIAERRKAFDTPLMKVRSPKNELNKTSYAFWIRDTSGPEGVIAEGLDLDRAYEKGFRKTNSSYYNDLLPRNPIKGFPDIKITNMPKRPFPSLATDFSKQKPMISGDTPEPFVRDEFDFRSYKWSPSGIDKDKLQPEAKDDTPFFPAPKPVRGVFDGTKFDIFKPLGRKPSDILPFALEKITPTQRQTERKAGNDTSRYGADFTDNKLSPEPDSSLKKEADTRAEDTSWNNPVIPPSTRTAPTFDRYKKYPHYMGYGSHFRFNDSISRFTNLAKTTGRLSVDQRISADRPLPDSERPISFFMKPRTSPYNQDYFQSLIRRPFGNVNQERYTRHFPSFHRHDRNDDFTFNR